MIQPRCIISLASTPATWHLDAQASRDVWPWLANSPSGRSGDISDFSHPTKGFGARIPSCTGARAVPVLPNTPFATVGSGRPYLPSAKGFARANQRPRHCAQPALSMPTGRTSRRTLHAAAPNVVRKTKRKDGLAPRAIAVISPSAASPCPRSASLDQPARNLRRPTKWARPSRAAAIARGPHAMDAIAARPADKRPHTLVTHAPVAPAHSGFPYLCNTSPAPTQSRRCQSFGDHP